MENGNLISNSISQCNGRDNLSVQIVVSLKIIIFSYLPGHKQIKYQLRNKGEKLKNFSTTDPPIWESFAHLSSSFAGDI